ncbi:MAG TPA: hypothetical protein VN132_07185, partial [Bdellovibrio sp.]|nr:hypothetical protein [Bdellovibrio sp.]
ALEGNGSGGFFKTSRGGSVAAVQSRKAQPVNMAGWTEDERKKLEKKNDAGRTKVISTGEVTAPPKKIAVKKPEPKVEVKEDDQPMTIGNFIRFLFIAALIIALVIFIGGQALSMSKES